MPCRATMARRMPRQDAEKSLQESLRGWQEWAAVSKYRGPYRDPVMRSLIVLKGLTYRHPDVPEPRPGESKIRIELNCLCVTAFSVAVDFITVVVMLDRKRAKIRVVGGRVLSRLVCNCSLLSAGEFGIQLVGDG